MFDLSFLSVETEGFKIDTMGTYHGLSLESVKVIIWKFLQFSSVLSGLKTWGETTTASFLNGLKISDIDQLIALIFRFGVILV